MRGQVRGADNVARKGFKGGVFRGVGRGEDGDFGIVEHAGGDGAEEEFAEASAAMGGHDDDAGAAGLGAIDDFVNGVADAEIAIDGEAGEFGGLKGVEFAAQFLHDEAEVVLERCEFGWDASGFEHVQESNLRIEAAGEGGDERGHGFAADGEIDGEEDVSHGDV